VLPDEPLVAVGAVAVGAAVFAVVCVRWHAALDLPSLRALRRRAPRSTPSTPAEPTHAGRHRAPADPAESRALTGGAP